jgi:hypothetical protein
MEIARLKTISVSFPDLMRILIAISRFQKDMKKLGVKIKVEICEFMSFQDLEKLFESEKIRAEMLKKH